MTCYYLKVFKVVLSDLFRTFCQKVLHSYGHSLRPVHYVIVVFVISTVTVIAFVFIASEVLFCVNRFVAFVMTVVDKIDA